MNCCDEYGNCRQGRDCPVRRKMEDGLAEHYQAHWKPVHSPRLDAVITAVLIFSLLCLAKALHEILS